MHSQWRRPLTATGHRGTRRPYRVQGKPASSTRGISYPPNRKVPGLAVRTTVRPIHVCLAREPRARSIKAEQCPGPWSRPPSFDLEALALAEPPPFAPGEVQLARSNEHEADHQQFLCVGCHGLDLGAVVIKKNRERRTKAALETPARGTDKTAPGRRPHSRARSRRCLCPFKSPEGSGWRFFEKQRLTLARRLDCLVTLGDRFPCWSRLLIVHARSANPCRDCLTISSARWLRRARYASSGR